MGYVEGVATNHTECTGGAHALVCGVAHRIGVHLPVGLLDGGAPGLHFYTLNQSAPTLRVLDNLAFKH